MIGYEGPEEQWMHELKKASKSGLIDLVKEYFFVFGMAPEKRLEKARRARKEGKLIDWLKASQLRRQDPELFLERSLQRRLSAAKAARRRKKERKG